MPHEDQPAFVPQRMDRAKRRRPEAVRERETSRDKIRRIIQDVRGVLETEEYLTNPETAYFLTDLSSTLESHLLEIDLDDPAKQVETQRHLVVLMDLFLQFQGRPEPREIENLWNQIEDHMFQFEKMDAADRNRIRLDVARIARYVLPTQEWVNADAVERHIDPDRKAKLQKVFEQMRSLVNQSGITPVELADTWLRAGGAQMLARYGFDLGPMERTEEFAPKTERVQDVMRPNALLKRVQDVLFTWLPRATPRNAMVGAMMVATVTTGSGKPRRPEVSRPTPAEQAAVISLEQDFSADRSEFVITENTPEGPVTKRVLFQVNAEDLASLNQAEPLADNPDFQALADYEPGMPGVNLAATADQQKKLEQYFHDQASVEASSLYDKPLEQLTGPEILVVSKSVVEKSMEYDALAANITTKEGQTEAARLSATPLVDLVVTEHKGVCRQQAAAYDQIVDYLSQINAHPEQVNVTTLPLHNFDVKHAWNIDVYSIQNPETGEPELVYIPVDITNTPSGDMEISEGVRWPTAAETADIAAATGTLTEEGVVGLKQANVEAIDWELASYRIDPEKINVEELREFVLYHASQASAAESLAQSAQDPDQQAAALTVAIENYKAIDDTLNDFRQVPGYNPKIDTLRGELNNLGKELRP